MKGLLIKIRYLLDSVSRIGQPHIGAHVVYNGERCVLTQGVKDPKWNMSGLESNQYYKDVLISDCVLDRSFQAKWKAFKFHYDFRMTYWYDIELHKAVS